MLEQFRRPLPAPFGYAASAALALALVLLCAAAFPDAPDYVRLLYGVAAAALGLLIARLSHVKRAAALDEARAALTSRQLHDETRRRDLLRGLQSFGRDAAAREAMRTQFTFARHDEALHTAQQKMLTSRTRALAVLNPEGELLGLLTADDINEAYRLMGIGQKLAVHAR